MCPTLQHFRIIYLVIEIKFTFLVESFCRIVNGPEMATLSVPSEIYHTLEEPTEKGDYQVSGKVTPYGSGSTPQERVYSVLEDDSEGERLGRTPDSEYLVVLPDYEQPERSPASNE